MWRPGQGKTYAATRRTVRPAIWTCSKSFDTISTIGWRIAISRKSTRRTTKKRSIKLQQTKMRQRTKFIKWRKTSRFPRIIIQVNSSASPFSTTPEKTRADSRIIRALIRVPWCIRGTVRIRRSRWCYRHITRVVASTDSRHKIFGRRIQIRFRMPTNCTSRAKKCIIRCWVLKWTVSCKFRALSVGNPTFVKHSLSNRWRNSAAISFRRRTTRSPPRRPTRRP